MMSTLRANLSHLWQSRAPREQRIILIAAALLAVALWFLLLIEPALSGTARLSTSLQALNTKAAQVEQLAGGVTSRGSAPLNTADAVTASLLGAGLSADSVSVSPAAPWVVTVKQAQGAPLWAWLAAHPASTANLSRTDANLWSGQVTVAQ